LKNLLPQDIGVVLFKEDHRNQIVDPDSCENVVRQIVVDVVAAVGQQLKDEQRRESGDGDDRQKFVPSFRRQHLQKTVEIFFFRRRQKLNFNFNKQAAAAEPVL
jgi:hypothetical protein